MIEFVLSVDAISGIFMFFVAWFVLLMVGMTEYLTRGLTRAVCGVVIIWAIVMAFSIILCLFTPTPYGIQMVNFTVVHP